MITDVFAHIGPWPRRPAGVDAAGLRALLGPYDVTRIYAGRTEALWFENPHDANRLFEPRGSAGDLVDVPVLDPTIATWRDELERLARRGSLAMVRLYPSYGGYTLEAAGPLLDELARRNVVAQVVVRMDDPRRQHRLAPVADVPAPAVLDAAARHPGLKLLMSGALGPSLAAIAAKLPAANNLWADTSQADGLGTVAALAATAWRDRLVFGSHAPLFIAYSAVARVLVDLDDAAAEPILRTNAARLLS